MLLNCKPGLWGSVVTIVVTVGTAVTVVTDVIVAVTGMTVVTDVTVVVRLYSRW